LDKRWNKSRLLTPWIKDGRRAGAPDPFDKRWNMSRLLILWVKDGK
jgi:hypothetical protein